ncbi:MAG: hypothetical protein WCC22_20760 [Terriglobales bacterium]
MFSRVLLALFASLTLSVAGGQTKVVVLPRGPVTRIVSPDRKWILIFECRDYSQPRKLWIEQSRMHRRRAVRDFERSLSISWAPNSRSFFVSDDLGSNKSESYLYDPVTLRVTDLAAVIVAADAGAGEYLKAGHSYLQAKRWINSHELLVTLFGHFDEPPQRVSRVRHPRGFTLRYHVDLNGAVHKLAESSEENPE